MSPRAAARLEALGFEHVYDYVEGKKDWITAGLPLEGRRSDELRALDLAVRDVPTCAPGQPVGALGDRSDVEEWQLCVVVDGDRVVHGRITDDTITTAGPGDRVEGVMELGPATIRPRASLESALDRMDDSGTDSILVTTEFGELLGLLYRSEIESHPERESH